MNLPKRILVRDVMTKDIITLKPGQPVTDAAKILSDNRIGGAPVVDDDGRLVGIISESDLIIQDIKLHFPTYVQLLDGYIYLGSLAKFEAELRKAVGAKVKNLMTADVVTTTGEATVEDVATLMVERDISRVPVVKDSLVVGVVAKSNLVRLLGRD